MLTTPNFLLKKIELTDSPPDITVINFNWDTIDTKLKEALTKADDWSAFKTKGGTVNGPMRIGGTNALTLYQLKSISSGDAIWADDLYPNTRGGNTLGNSEWTWKDIFLSGLSKSTNGYTKLPNGLLLQWGALYYASPSFVGGQSVPDQTLSVAFPARLIGCYAYAYYVEGGYAGQIHTKCLSDGDLTKVSIHSYFGENLGGKRVYYRWFALGY